MANHRKQSSNSEQTYRRLLKGQASSKDYVSSLKKEARSARTGRVSTSRRARA